jgi:hypothetical protein
MAEIITTAMQTLMATAMASGSDGKRDKKAPNQNPARIDPAAASKLATYCNLYWKDAAKELT